jgi:UDP:flavonoid glycosyltransferase YjiC (YdhE family)
VTHAAGAREPTIAIFAMTEVGHLERVRGLITGLAGMGADVRVFTDRRFRESVEEAGGRWVDMLGRHPLAEADDESYPLSCRNVTYAAHFAEAVAAEVDDLGASLVVCDTFAVIGRVVASLLGIPHVNVCAGHNLEPIRTAPQLLADQRFDVSPRCERAIALLRERYGMPDASPTSYIDGASRLLNLYCEPPAFLRPEERPPFEPIAFHGSLPPLEQIEAALAVDGPAPFGVEARLRVYASFGTVVWRHWPKEALAALTATASALGHREDTSLVVALGGTAVGDAARRRLERLGAVVEDYADQWRTLAAADVLITHNGLNTTHEAIFCEVPMVSYPFFGDQPGLAARCEELGLAVPLAPRPRAPIAERDVLAALDRVSSERDRIQANLATARAWELETIAARPAIWRRILDLSAQAPSAVSGTRGAPEPDSAAR